MKPDHFKEDTRLREMLIGKIKEEGPVSFETFMEMALYYPELGFYAREISPIGREADFYTGPHVHALFGAVLGRQMEEMWRILGEPGEFTVMEMGAGAGYLAKDLLDYLKDRPLYRQIHYVIMEPNPHYRAMQRTLLAQHGSKITWHEHLGEAGAFTGCFLSNELMDALPVRLVEMEDDLMEVFIGVGGGSFQELRKPAPEDLRHFLDDFSINVEPGYRTEINLRIRDLLSQVADRIDSGYILTIDYGYPASEYYSPGRNRGTLLCYYRHEVNDEPLEHIGSQDITAHVNFSSLKRWGEEQGLTCLGFTGQGAYLTSLGIHELLPLYFGNPPNPVEMARVKQLIMPQGMGETHKVMLQAKGAGFPEMRGFALRNESGRL